MIFIKLWSPEMLRRSRYISNTMLRRMYHVTMRWTVDHPIRTGLQVPMTPGIKPLIIDASMTNMNPQQEHVTEWKSDNAYKTLLKALRHDKHEALISMRRKRVVHTFNYNTLTGVAKCVAMEHAGILDFTTYVKIFYNYDKKSSQYHIQRLRFTDVDHKGVIISCMERFDPVNVNDVNELIDDYNHSGILKNDSKISCPILVGCSCDMCTAHERCLSYVGTMYNA